MAGQAEMTGVGQQGALLWFNMDDGLGGGTPQQRAAMTQLAPVPPEAGPPHWLSNR